MPSQPTLPHDYNVTASNCRQKEELGISGAEWYRSPISRAELKELMKRRDGPALASTALWLGGIFVFGLGGYLTWGTWWSVPFFIIYGVFCASAADSRWHEMGHGTAFRTRWLNDVVYNIASFLMLREPTVWRWSHTRHHSDTIVVGCDPEIVAERPPDIPSLLINLLNLKNLVTAVRKLFIHAAGRLTESEESFIPEAEHWKVYRTARIWLGIYAVVIALAVATGSILPLMYIGFPVVYGAWLGLVFAASQHLGLNEDVSDYRLNTRTIYMNPLLRFLYLNMNYHVEHHMFPMVPYYNLPKLHEKLKADMPPAYDGLIEVYRELIPALVRQRKEPGHSIARELPPTARPYVRPQSLEAMSPAE